MPFRLRWPTEFPTIIQPFGVNTTGIPDFYTRFGLPAHEGVDFAAPTGSKIFACADGTISQISNGKQTDGSVHPYGIHIRIKHVADDGEYETIYGHLLKPREGLKTGDTVTAGELIANADNTGNSRGDHLHLTLKKKGATLGGETKFTMADGKVVTYPRDIMNPMAFLDPFTIETTRTSVKPVNNLAFLEDVTIPDETVLPGGAPFVKTWKVRNNGTTDWASGFKFEFIANTPMTMFTDVPLPPAKASEDATITIAMIAPVTPGRYKCTWRARDPEGNFFGHDIFVIIRVVKGAR
jgi:murein DD-endopeptidase MepM/ murein hydrolase activator NlpD